MAKILSQNDKRLNLLDDLLDKEMLIERHADHEGRKIKDSNWEDKYNPETDSSTCPRCGNDYLFCVGGYYECTYCDRIIDEVVICENCNDAVAKSSAFVPDILDEESGIYYCDENCFQLHFERFQE